MCPARYTLVAVHIAALGEDGRVEGGMKMFVNEKLYESDYRDYVIAPYSDVPPGDSIKIVFE